MRFVINAQTETSGKKQLKNQISGTIDGEKSDSIDGDEELPV